MIDKPILGLLTFGQNPFLGQESSGDTQKDIFSIFFHDCFVIFYIFRGWGAANQSAASAASLGSVKFEAVIKSAASAASPRGGRASGRLDRGFFCAVFGRASGRKIVKISDSPRLPLLGIPGERGAN